MARLAGIITCVTAMLLIFFVNHSKEAVRQLRVKWDEQCVTASDYTVHIRFKPDQIRNWEQKMMRRRHAKKSKGY